MGKGIKERIVPIVPGIRKQFYKYIDTRNIYSENQIVYNDPVNNYQEKVQKAIDDRIRAEQHLRRIRGY